MKTKIIKKTDVIHWLKTQPPDRRFNYFNNTACLFASFGKEVMRRKGQHVYCMGDVLLVGSDTFHIPFEQKISALPTNFTASDALGALRAR